MIHGCTDLTGRLIFADWLEERQELPKLAGLLRLQGVQPNRYGQAPSHSHRMAFFPLADDAFVWSVTNHPDPGVSFAATDGKTPHYLHFQIQAQSCGKALAEASAELVSRGGRLIGQPRHIQLLDSGSDDEVLKHNKLMVTELCRLFALLDVEQVVVEYDGYGDSGQTEEVTFHPDDSIADQLPPCAFDTLECLAEVFLPDGYEINDGSFGELHIDVETGKVRREHNWRFTDSVYEEEEL